MNAERKAWLAVIFGASLIALVSARPYAGGWNDGDRLAQVESLIDHHSLQIDESIFLKRCRREESPYENGWGGGTYDKLWIAGHWYSDKPPVPALLMAAVYQLLQWLTELTAQFHPRAFCYWMTVLSSGLAYVVAVAGIFRLGGLLGLPLRLRLGVAVSFAVGTLALVYVRYFNNHIMLLAAAVWLVVFHVRLAQEEPRRLLTLLSLGNLAGLAYAIDLGVGPVLWSCSLLAVAARTRSLKAAGVVLLAALPWLALHHAVNFAIGGTIKPAAAVREYLEWPGSPCLDSFTGQWSHHSIGHATSYAVQLLVGKKGFLGHNMPLLLMFPALACLVRRRTPYLMEAWMCLAMCGGAWLIYSVASSNYAGACCSIRWFVPLLGPGYFLIMLLLHEAPRRAADLGVLTVGGAALMLTAWPEGPWRLGVLPAYWPLLGTTLLAWVGCRWLPLVRARLFQARSAVSHCPFPLDDEESAAIISISANAK